MSADLPDDLTADALGLPYEWHSGLSDDVWTRVAWCRLWGDRIVARIEAERAATLLPNGVRDLLAAGVAAAWVSDPALDEHDVAEVGDALALLGRRAGLSVRLLQSMELHDDDVSRLLGEDDDGTGAPYSG